MSSEGPARTSQEDIPRRDRVRPPLLAIDLGLRAGLAHFGADGRLKAYRSTNFGSTGRLRSAVYGILRDAEPLEWIVLEGDRALGDIWEKTARKRKIASLRVSAEEWRSELIIPRARRTGRDAKATAMSQAREIIIEAGLDAPATLRHDAAEAILIGTWSLSTWSRS